MPEQDHPTHTIPQPSSDHGHTTPLPTWPLPSGAWPVPAPPVQRRRQSRLPVVLASLLLLIGLLVVGDRVGERAAEGYAAERLQTELGLAQAPTVDLVGVPFLDQLAVSTFRQVVIDANGVPLGASGASRTSGTLDHLHLDLRQVTTSDGYRSAHVDRATGWAQFGWPAISILAGGVDVAFDGVDPSGRGRIRLAVTQKVFGSQINAEIRAVPDLDASSQTIVFRDPAVRLLGVDLPASVGTALLGAFLKPIPVETPAGLGGTALAVTADGARLDLAGEDLTLGV